MKRLTAKSHSLYVQLVKLLLVSAAAALLIFITLNYICETAIDYYCYDSAYVRERDQKYVKKLQKYIDKHHLGSRDTDKLYSWIKNQKVLSVCIYKDGIQIFDTDYPDQTLWDEEISINEKEWENYYSVTFSDGEAIVSISGMYAYQFYNYALLAELTISFSCFLMFVLLGIRTKMNYIMKLNAEIEILEGGSLDYEVTVKGHDELAALAEGLNNMRISVQNLIHTETEIIQENQKIVTEMSHDLRTPVTSILLYTEILKKGRYNNKEQLLEYVERIDRQAWRMKQLTDHLFEYSLVTGKTDIALEKPENLKLLFYDQLSETCSYLEQRGFHIRFNITWNQASIQTCTDYLMRIMDNITSNIIKYADPEEPLVIRSVNQGNMIGFSFENKVKQTNQKPESTCVGIQSIRNMMMKVNGTCIVQQGNEKFGISILFPLYTE